MSWERPWLDPDDRDDQEDEHGWSDPDDLDDRADDADDLLFERDGWDEDEEGGW